MNVAQEELNGWCALALRVKNGIWNAQIAKTMERRHELLNEAASLAANLQTRLDRAGAEKPASVPGSRYETPLALLDTPANRRYLLALQAAWDAGLAVDRERYGESIGTDGCAQIIEMVLRDVETEVLGAASSHE